jgi:methenyltetrahydromethanopterin cyclohydrolase
VALAVPKLSPVDVAFPANPPLPAWDEIPEQFKRGSNDYARVARALFSNGATLSDCGLRVKDGLDAGDVMDVLCACLGSFRPKHEHKMAGVAYMLSEWCDGKPCVSRAAA